MDIQFIGATGTVTGSKYLLTSGNQDILVDCGLFQGLKQLRLRNWNPLPFKASQIKSILLTHAHIDHSGFIPLLVKEGFRGKIYCSRATAEICAILLPDSGHLQEEDAAFENRHEFSKHNPSLPLYTRLEAINSLSYFHPVPYNEELDLGNMKATFLPAGHILGASLIKVTDGNVSILFSGDLGRPHDDIMKPPTIIDQADYLVMESTYGNRRHSDVDPKQELADVINRTTHRGGVTIIPAFAVGRAQSILHLLYLLKEENKIPNIPVYVDSPMATDVTDLYCRYSHEHHLSHGQCAAMCQVAKFTNTTDESKLLDLDKFPKIIITASGMATGGRVLHHLKAYITDHKNTILFTGYQAAGTRGEALIHGANRIKIHGEYYPVEAEIVMQDSLSAHSDYQESLDWLRHFKSPPKMTFLTHGEPIAADALRHSIEEELHWNCRVPEYLERVHLK